MEIQKDLFKEEKIKQMKDIEMKKATTEKHQAMNCIVVMTRSSPNHSSEEVWRNKTIRMNRCHLLGDDLKDRESQHRPRLSVAGKTPNDEERARESEGTMCQ